MTEEPVKRIAIDVPDSTVRRVKAAAAMEGVNLSTFCSRVLAKSVIMPENSPPRTA